MHRLAISIAVPVLHLGSGPDVLVRLCGALHAWNRHADPGEYLAIAFPHLSPENDKSRGKSGFLVFGADIEVYGSRTATQAFLSGQDMDGLQRRGMITCREEELSNLQGVGVAFVRERKTEKTREGYLRRLQTRSAKNGPADALPPMMGIKDMKKNTHKGFITARKGFRINFLAKKGEVSPVVQVSTYGLSSPATPAFLPCAPSSALRDIEAMGLDLENL